MHRQPRVDISVKASPLHTTRKVIKLMAGGLIFTGQERPVSTRQDICDDLWVTCSSGDGLGRPSALRHYDQGVPIVGWKCLEMNELMVSKGGPEIDIECILKRSLFIKLVARFFDEGYSRRHLPDHEQFGVCARIHARADDIRANVPGGDQTPTSVRVAPKQDRM